MPRHDLPESLYWGPRWYYERYGLPIYGTDNGMSLTDWVSLDGPGRRSARFDFLRRFEWYRDDPGQRGEPVGPVMRGGTR